MKNLVVLGFLGIGLVGCSSISVKPVSVNTLKQAPLLCIEDNPKVTVQDFNKYLAEAFLDHGIKTKLFDKGAISSDCTYKLNYVAYRSWDLAVYLSKVDLQMFERENLIAEVNWTQGSGAINKWRNTKGKVDDLVSELLGEAKVNVSSREDK